jgi:hypothetical protein
VLLLGLQFDLYCWKGMIHEGVVVDSRVEEEAAIILELEVGK